MCGYELFYSLAEPSRTLSSSLLDAISVGQLAHSAARSKLTRRRSKAL